MPVEALDLIATTTEGKATFPNIIKECVVAVDGASDVAFGFGRQAKLGRGTVMTGETLGFTFPIGVDFITFISSGTSAIRVVVSY